MRTILDAARSGHAAPTRLIMLPAAYAQPEDYVREGFASAVRTRGLAIDLVFAGLDLQHVADRTVLRQLREELIRPGGRAALWLGGISLGAYVALSYAARHAGELAGLCVFAPYLGSHIVTGEIERAGGVRAWRPGELAEDDDERRIWHFLKTRREGSVSVHLGLGSEDRFARRHRLMAAALTAESVDTVAGGHDWPTWRRLWENFLDARFARPVSHA